MMHRTISCSLLFVGLCLLADPAKCAAQGAPEALLRVPAQSNRTLQRFEAWKGLVGSGWAIDLDPHTGWANFLGGGRFAPDRIAHSDQDRERLARRALVVCVGLVGVEESSLVLNTIKFLPLGLIGSTDKWSVSFSQEHAGLEVLGARVNVLFDLDGAMLSIQTSALTRLAGLDLTPQVTARAARLKAQRAFEDELGLTPDTILAPRLAVGWTLQNDEREPRLVWETSARWMAPGQRAEGLRFWIDGLSGELLLIEKTVHDFDVSGTVRAFVTPGTTPDTAANPALSWPIKDLRVKSPAGNVITDGSGNFVIPGTLGPLQVTVEFVGPWAHVDNDAGPEELFIGLLSGSGNAITLNPTPAEAVTSQANVFVAMGLLRDWIRTVDPTDSTADFQAYARVNLASVCNAYYDGFSVNFFASGSSGGPTCVNTGYSTVVAHEMGHWLNERYHTYNGSDGMGEGNADVFSMYLYDTPIVGGGFFGSSTQIRTGLNTTMFCGDCCPGCHGGQVHLEGEAWMGAAWKVRSRLNITNGNLIGDLVANGLFIAWLNAYDQSQIRSVIELQWLVLDDDNGDLDDGTPHYGDIDPGFRDQGFPGFDLPAILFSDVTILGDTLDVLGPYAIEATVEPQTAATISSVTLNYAVNGGSWSVSAMIPVGGDLYQIGLPGQISIAFVEYYLTAIDTNSQIVDFPKDGATNPIRFVVGGAHVLYSDDFESGDDNGWTHGSFGDTSNSHDDYQRGTPGGRAGDPSQAYSGLNVWGNDLGQGAWNGAYQNNQHNWLRTPPIDCSQASNCQVRFKSWLNVDAQENDVAEVRVNGVQVSINELGVATENNQWTSVTLNVANEADGQASVVVEFALASNATGTHGGWNLDDFELRFVTLAPNLVGSSYCFGDGSGEPCPCGNTGLSGTGCSNSSGLGALLAGLGTASIAANDLFFQAHDLKPGQPALLFAGFNAVNGGVGTVFGDGLRCAGGGLARLGVQAADATGSATWATGLVAANGWQAGATRRFQAWYRDPSGSPCGSQFNLSQGLEISFSQ